MLPFAWIKIPAGKVTIDSKPYDVAPFEISKYPITHAQYKPFIADEGYTTDRWWTAQGLQAKQERNWTHPRWNTDKYTGDTQPVVDLSWYEAVAFCLWLNEKTGENFMLPTEQQWQRAAQGDDERIYPWGNEWNAKFCNSRESQRYVTTPVTQYEGLGDSPFGVVDMCGNCGEWCVTDFHTGINDIAHDSKWRVVRSGSFYYTKDNLEVSKRFGLYPIGDDVRSLSFNGFRIVRINASGS